MVDWKSLRTAKQAEIQQLAGVQVSEVTPSIRNFAQYVTTHKQDLALIAALKRVDPQTGRSWHDRDLVALAQECDDAEVGAIAVYTEPSVFGTSLDDLRAVSLAVLAPVLRLDLLVHPAQIHHARLCGADAVLLCAGAVDTATLTNLLAVASSTHVTAVVAVQSEAEVGQALAAGALILGIASPSGLLDLAQIAALATLIPAQKTTVALDEIGTLKEYSALQEKVDAVLVSNLILDASEVSVTLAKICGR
jgi:indole-3-glycerol phosphate synthase